MRFVKLSLAAALAAGAFSVANATPLEEAIKDIDLSGALRYRYNNGDISKTHHSGFTNGTGGIGTPRQAHNFVAKLGFQAAIADDFKAFVEFAYNAKQEEGFGKDSSAKTNEGFKTRQFYLTYTAEPVNTSILFGKMQIESIWTTSFLGLVGTGVKILNTSLDGTVLAAYAFDNLDAGEFENDYVGSATFGSGSAATAGVTKGDKVFADSLTYDPYKKNLYGVAGIGSYDLGFGQLNSQVWLAYLTDTMFLYAVDLGYKTTFANDLGWQVNLGYLGNAAMDDYEHLTDLKRKTATGGNFVGLNGTLEYAGFDASLGGFYYGDEDKFTLTVLEDNGNIGHLLAGQEIYYTTGSNLTGDIGENTFGFIKGGYTFNEVLRFGFDFVYGGTKTSSDKTHGGGDKLEAVARVNYKYSPKLDFQAWYSYVDIDSKSSAHDNSKNSVRLQALYKF